MTFINKQKQDFLNWIYDLRQEQNLLDWKKESISEKTIKRIEEHTNYVFQEISRVLNEQEFLKLDFDKLLDIWNVLSYKNQFKTNFWFNKWLLLNWWLSLNLDLWDYCKHNCSHCMLSAWESSEKCDIEWYLKQFDSFDKEKLEKYIKEITFFNFWELLDYENFDKIFKYFLDRWIKKFDFVTRWPAKQNIDEVIKKIEILKKNYKNFNLTFVLSFDDFSQNVLDNNLLNLSALYYTNKYILNNRNVLLNTTIETGNFKENYDIFMIKLSNFINIVEKNNIKGQYRIENDKWGIIKKIIFDDWFEIDFKFNFLKPIWRGKNITNEKIDNSWVDFTNCHPVVNPYSVNLDKSWNLKTCFSKDIPASKKYKYSNISDKDFLEQFFNIKRKYFKDISVEDLVWKWNRHFCMALNLLNEDKST